jgi:hypothetical protein
MQETREHTKSLKETILVDYYNRFNQTNLGLAVPCPQQGESIDKSENNQVGLLLGCMG